MDAQLTALADAVDRLHGAPLTGLADSEVVEVLRRMEICLRKLSAVGHRVIVETVERSIPGSLDCRSITDYLTRTLRISGADAARRVRGAVKVGTWHTAAGEQMDPVLTETARAVREGAVGPDHVAAIAKTMRKVPHATPAELIDVAEQILAEAARSTTPEDVTRLGVHLLAHLNPNGPGPDERDRKRMRGLRIGKQGTDLMTPVSGLLDPEALALLEPVLAKLARPGIHNPDDPESSGGDIESPDLDREALAKAAARDTRTAVQRNHDALKVALRHLLASGTLGSHRGLPVTAIVTMTAAQVENASGVATTATGGLVPIRDALRMAEHAHPVLALFDHRGRPLHLGRSKRLASPDQRLALIAASRGCTRPGCDAPASLTAVHHVTEWRDGGRTDIGNLDLVCDHCHALVHDGAGGWQTRTAADGTANTGRTEWVPPPHIDPARTPQVNDRHHLDRTVAQALANYRARRDAEARAHRQQSQYDSEVTSDGDVP